jgi:predicted HTH domain antitoxin
MCQIAFEIPNEVLYDTKMSKDDALSYARKAVALQYYVRNGVSLGYCAQIAETDKEDFIHYLSQNEVSIFHFDDRDEFLEEMNNA